MLWAHEVIVQWADDFTKFGKISPCNRWTFGQCTDYKIAIQFLDHKVALVPFDPGALNGVDAEKLRLCQGLGYSHETTRIAPPIKQCCCCSRTRSKVFPNAASDEEAVDSDRSSRLPGSMRILLA